MNLTPLLWTAALAAALLVALRRWFDPVPGWFAALAAVAVLGLHAPGLVGGAAMLGQSEIPGLETAGLPHNDLTLRTLPALAAAKRAVKAGEWPLWQPHSGLGLPLLGEPVSQPLTWATVPLSLTGQAAAVPALRGWLALVFSFLLLRRLAAPSTATTAATVGAFTYLSLAGLDDLHWPTAEAATWLPVLLYALLRCDRSTAERAAGGRSRDLLLLAGATAAFLLSAEATVTAWGLVFVGAFAVARLGRPARPRRARLGTAVEWGAALVLGALLVSPVVVLRQEAVAETFPARLAVGEHNRSVQEDPFGLKTWSDGEARSVWWRSVEARVGTGVGGRGLVGALLWSLGAVGLLLRRPRWRDEADAGRPVAVVFLLLLPPLLLLPGLLPLVRGIVALPALDLAGGRSVFAVAAVWGVARLLRATAALETPPARLVTAAIAAAACLPILLAATAPPRDWEPGGEPYPATAALAELHRLAAATPGFRVLGDGVLLPPQTSAVYGLPDARVHHRSIPLDQQWLAGTVLRPVRPKSSVAPVIDDPLLDLLAVRWVLTPTGRRLAATLRFEHPSGWIYERPTALPLLLLPESAVARGDRPWRPWVRENEDFAARALLQRLEGDRQGVWRVGEGGEADRVVLEDRAATRITARSRTGEPRLVTAAVYFGHATEGPSSGRQSGWRLLVDGERRPTVRANGALVGAWLPAGEHRLEFLYRPPGLVLWALLAALSLAGLAALAMRQGRAA